MVARGPLGERSAVGVEEHYSPDAAEPTEELWHDGAKEVGRAVGPGALEGGTGCGEGAEARVEEAGGVAVEVFGEPVEVRVLLSRVELCLEAVEREDHGHGKDKEEYVCGSGSHFCWYVDAPLFRASFGCSGERAVFDCLRCVCSRVICRTERKGGAMGRGVWAGKGVVQVRRVLIHYRRWGYEGIFGGGSVAALGEGRCEVRRNETVCGAFWTALPGARWRAGHGAVSAVAATCLREPAESSRGRF